MSSYLRSSKDFHNFLLTYFIHPQKIKLCIVCVKVRNLQLYSLVTGFQLGYVSIWINNFKFLKSWLSLTDNIPVVLGWFEGERSGVQFGSHTFPSCPQRNKFPGIFIFISSCVSQIYIPPDHLK